MLKATVKELAEIIEWIGDKSSVLPIPTRKILSDRHLQELKDDVLRLDKNTAGKKIIEMQEDLHRDARYITWQPYLMLFLAYAYSILGVGSDALKYAKRSAHSCLWPSEWEKALSYWFLGIVYCQNNLFAEASMELTTAKEFLEKHCKKAWNEAKYDEAKECKAAISGIEGILADLPLRIPQPLLAISQGGGYKPPAQPVSTKEQDEKNQKDGTLPMNINIHNPVDIHPSIDIHPTVEINPIVDIHPSDSFHLDANLSSWLWYVSPLREADRPSLLESEAPPQPQSSDETKDLFDLSYIVTPSFPLYGGATAGLNGWPVLDGPDYSAVIDETSLIRLEKDKEYRIYSEKKGDKQISVSTSDFLTSILPPQISERFKLRGKRYGWLKVAGNSMNKTKPIPIESDDYVLFYESDNNDEPAACLDKIVVAALLDESNRPRLAVKRIIKKAQERSSGGNSDKANGQPAEMFCLHSDSSDPDPDTGKDYEDQKLDAHHRIAGIVVAVASIKQKPTI